MTPAHGGERRAGRWQPADPAPGRDPTFHQLRLFLLLVQERHFGRAAARAYLTQPAFSKQIRALESRLGAVLAERGGSGRFRLTAAGRGLIPCAEAALEARARMGALRGQDLPQRIRLGAIGGEAAMPYAQSVLRVLRARHPALEAEVRGVDFVEQIEALRDGTLDAAFLRLPLPAELDWVVLAREPRVVCLSADDPLAARSAVTLADLAQHTVADVPPQVPRAWWDHWTVNPRPDGTRVRYGVTVSDIEALLFAVAHQHVIAFVPAAARTLYPRPGLTYLDISDAPPSIAVLAWPTARQGTPLLTALRAAAAAAAAENT
ncbi:LysR family transcriptional regulator [Streptomyces sp. PsTaAH-124]|uniref:LysR family transcriptional regulator n=1 Tax=Streptomyces sp. PsTaAH-124 TaxID=1157638 RepID=UPI0003713837|nr:LysR family transcriptional regulator [Streptomyces sp. PsTaAH-124]